MEEQVTMEDVGQVSSRKFHSRLRVLLIDDDPTCLEILRSRLQVCQYEVTPCTSAEDALSLLLEKKDGFDIVLTDFRMPGMDGLQLLESIRTTETTYDLPVILFSGEQDEEVVTRGIEKGACEFLLKPIGDETLKMIWQHVLRPKLRKEEHDVSESNYRLERSESAIQSSSDDAISNQSEGSSRRRKDPCVGDTDDNGTKAGNATTSGSKKARVHWTPELHEKFLKAIDIINKRKNPDMRFRSDGLTEAHIVPKEILEEMRKMGVEGLTRQNVSSHLQKHRTNRKKQVEFMEQQNSLPDPSYPTPCQYYYPMPTGSNSIALTRPYPAAYHSPVPRNFAVDCRVQQSIRNYFPGSGQQVGMLPAPVMPEQLLMPQNRPMQSGIWNRGPQHGNIGTAPDNMQFRPNSSVFGGQNQPMMARGTYSINPHSTFTPPTVHRQFVGNGMYAYKQELPTVSSCLQEPAEPSANIDPNFDMRNFAAPSSADELLRDVGQLGFEEEDLSRLLESLKDEGTHPTQHFPS